VLRPGSPCQPPAGHVELRVVLRQRKRQQKQRVQLRLDVPNGNNGAQTSPVAAESVDDVARATGERMGETDATTQPTAAQRVCLGG
jgi:hypothetical protein